LTNNKQPETGGGGWPRWRVIRISLIPSVIPEDKFKGILKDSIQGSNSQAPGWSLRSLCPDATFGYEGLSVAIVAFERTPPEDLLPVDEEVVLETSEYGNINVFIDDNFFGLTPLHSPHQENTTVE
jgi:hypothetical protein